jgi:hypothetical protein
MKKIKGRPTKKPKVDFSILSALMFWEMPGEGKEG